MSDLALLIPVAAIGIPALSIAFTTWVRARHGYPLSEKNGQLIGRGDPDLTRQFELLAAADERKAGQITRLEERIAVLERIATDPAERTAREIDQLRHRAD